MMHKVMRIGFLVLTVSAPAAVAAQTAPEPGIAADVSQLLDWIDGGLAQEATASPTPALGEGPVGQALGWLFGGETQSAATEAADPPAPQGSPEKPMASVVVPPPPTPAAAPVATAADLPEDEPLTLTPQPRPVATVRAQGLLLPVASP
jgi:hypothetical protein